MLSSITIASLSGTTQLLTLCITGAYLSHRRILTPAVTRSLSSSVYHAFLPALLFTSTFMLPQTVQKSSMLLPPLWALLTMLISAITATPIALITQPPIRRTVFVALLLGNANNLPLLLLHTLCEELPLNEHCDKRADSYVALYLAAWNTLMWTVVLQFLYNTPDETPSDTITVRNIQQTSSSGLLQTAAQRSVSSTGTALWQGFWKVFSPPFIAIITGCAFAFIPIMHDFVKRYLAAVLHALSLLADVVVPLSSLIVGARLFSYKYQEDHKTPPLTPFSIFLIVLTRFVLLPMVGRQIYTLFSVGSFVTDPLLRIYLLIPFFMPTASNSVVMVQMAAGFLPNVGERMEATLLVMIFWQYCVAPVFLTFNMAVGLAIVKESGGFGA